MKQKDLNIKYICEKTLLDKQDELVPIILKMIKESYKAGLNQAEYDNTMRIIEENESLKKQLENYYCNRTDCSGRIKDSKQYDSLVQKTENQQKEFVKYLEDEIKRLKESKKYAIEVFNNKAVINLDLAKKSIEEYRLLIAQSEKILSKYKEIIGGENENK